MKVFEELIEELKDENLIESTIFEIEPSVDTSSSENVDEVPLTAESENFVETDKDAGEADGHEISPSEAFRKQAMEEVSALQMVEHVFSGIEQKAGDASGGSFNDLRAKKALHVFLQVADEIGSEAFEEARKDLREQMEIWCTALAERDREIRIIDLRSFCENSRPVLSSQALIALARFYRNAPFSNDVREKFDFIITRLFSRESEDGTRRSLFGMSEMIGHLKTLYSRWESLSLFAAEDYADIVREHSIGLSHLASEAESYASLDSLVSSEIFSRLQDTRETLSEMFFVPEITAAAIDCNLRIGNKIIQLIWKEHSSGNNAALESFEDHYDEAMSRAACKTLNFAAVFNSTPENVAQIEPIRPTRRNVIEFERAPVVNDESRSFLKVNKWLLAATILVCLISGGVYLWAEQYESSQTVGKTAAAFNFGGSGVEKYIGNAKRTTETVYGITQPEWEMLDEKAQKQVLQDALNFAKGQGIKKIQLTNGKGRTVGFVSDGRIDVYQQ
ncbi:hypothetical protein [Leptolyngbya sp. 7M]|uniref:hypothetical protein n=1 Tax=Leptolyngbya sp. 7M TaxID=2812896 RepID=UPI001B8C3DAD|nr:hypothetical protein [Leptolyngbya sp. 7M]QYO67217.1 hypothetical protein JVX88_10675 [Leptolyngbya sp. 7M]